MPMSSGGGTTDQTPWETATFTKADVTAAGSSGAWTMVNSPITIATVTGTVLVRAFARITTTFTSTSNTGKPLLGAAGATSQLLSAVTADGTNLAEGFMWSSTSAGPLALWATNSQNFVPMTAGDIIITILTNDMTAGGVVIELQWIPLSAGATVVAATP